MVLSTQWTCSASTSAPARSSNVWQLQPVESKYRRRSSVKIPNRLDRKNSVHLPISFGSRRPFISLLGNRIRVRSLVVYASTSRHSSTEVASKGNGKGKRVQSSTSRGRSRGPQIAGQSQNQAKSDNPSSSKSSESDGQEGFAALSKLKTQLERDKKRISRVNVNDIGGVLQQKRSQPQGRQKRYGPTLIQSGTSAESDGRDRSNPRRMTPRVESQSRGATKIVILVRNLPKWLTEAEFQSAMMSIAQITTCRYLSDRQGLCSEFGLCEVNTEGDVEPAIEALSKLTLQGQKIEASLCDTIRDLEQFSARDLIQTVAASTSYEIEDKHTPLSSSPNTVEGVQTRRGQNLAKQQQEERDASAREVVEQPQGTSVESSQADEAVQNGRLNARSVFEAFQRAAIQEKPKPKKRRSRNISNAGTSSDSEDEERSPIDPSQPLAFRKDWASRIKELENDIRKMKMSIF